MNTTVLDQILSTGNKTTTNKGAPAHVSTLNYNLDFFSRAGNINYPHLERDFYNAFGENQNLALRNLFHMRDIRGTSGGYGVRGNFRTLLLKLTETNPEVFQNPHFLFKIIEVGRWDDLFYVVENATNRTVINLIVQLVGKTIASNSVETLLFKWFPLKNSKIATMVRSYLKLTPKELRKIVVERRSMVVERTISEKRWGDVAYSHVPSKAFKLYSRAFARNDSVRFSEFTQAAVKGEVKVNASAIWPHEVIGKASVPTEAIQAQWNALPDFIAEGVSIIPMIDISASMNCPSYSSYTCMDISTVLGAYIAERGKGPFQNLYITFSMNPVLGTLDPSKHILKNIQDITRFDMGLSTNIEKAMNLLLDFALKSEATQEDLPKYVLVLTDCQFDRQVRAGNTSAETWKHIFAEKGYIAPKLIYWNLSSTNDNTPVTFREDGTALISGASPSILKSVLSGDLEQYTPRNVMLLTLSSERYSI